MKKYLVLGLVAAMLSAGLPAGVHAAQDDAAAEESTSLKALEEAAAEAVADEGMEEAAAASEPSAFEVGRMVVAEGVADSEPVGATEAFSSEADKAYVFLEAREIQEDTEANFVWYRDGAEVARVALRLGQGPRWRTYSSKNINGLPGQWKVAVEDVSGNVLKTVAFSVE